MDDTCVKIKTQKVEAVTANSNVLDCSFRFTQEGVRESSLAFSECVMHTE